MKATLQHPTLVFLTVAFAFAGCNNASQSSVVPGDANAPTGFADARHAPQPSPSPKLYVAEEATSTIVVFDPTAPSPTPQAVITKGISRPWGIAIDRAANLYVANEGTRTVTVYRAGQTKPSFQIDSGLGDIPAAVAVDSTGNVFVSTVRHREIVAFHPGHKHAYQSVRLIKGTPFALAFDAGDNLFIADQKYVYELPRGATKAIDLGLSGLDGADGIAFSNGLMYVTNYTLNDVLVYKPGARSPFLKLSAGMYGPGSSTFVKPDEFFQVNHIGYNVEGFKRRQLKPFVTISGLNNPIGVASTPLQNP